MLLLLNFAGHAVYFEAERKHALFTKIFFHTIFILIAALNITPALLPIATALFGYPPRKYWITAGAFQ